MSKLKLEAELVAAFGCIHMRADSRQMIPDFVRAIVYFQDHVSIVTNAPNRHFPSTASQARHELDRLRKTAHALHAALSTLHRPAFDALRELPFKKLDGVKLAETDYFSVHSEMIAYTTQLMGLIPTARPEGKDHVGRPVNQKCLIFTEMLAQQYREMTRKTLNGTEERLPADYIDFVTRVFAACGFSETPAFFARMAVDIIRSK